MPRTGHKSRFAPVLGTRSRNEVDVELHEHVQHSCTTSGRRSPHLASSRCAVNEVALQDVLTRLAAALPPSGHSRIARRDDPESESNPLSLRSPSSRIEELQPGGHIAGVGCFDHFFPVGRRRRPSEDRTTQGTCRRGLSASDQPKSEAASDSDEFAPSRSVHIEGLVRSPTRRGFEP